MRKNVFSMLHESIKANGVLPYMLGLVSLLWLPFGLSGGIGDLAAMHLRSPYAVAMALGAILFVVIYTWGICMNVYYLATTVPPLGRTKTSAWVTFVLLLGLSVVMVTWNVNDWGGCFIFTSSYVSSRFTTMQSVWLIGITMLYPIIGFALGAINLSQLGAAIFLVGIVGFIVVSVIRSYRTAQELRVAREGLAHMAVANERLRIARDLHDLLGHNLSLITLKSDLAGRLLGKDIERAGREIRDIEQVARTTLQEVREAVGSYRQPTLASELHGAQEILAAAGIAYSLDGPEQWLNDLPRPVESALAWSVREGVTNIIRHSRARHCNITLVRTPQRCTVEIRDDGADTDGMGHEYHEYHEHLDGNGLRGLMERVESLGGQGSARPLSEGGFCLTVSVPLTVKGGASGGEVAIDMKAEEAPEIVERASAQIARPVAHMKSESKGEQV